MSDEDILKIFEQVKLKFIMHIGGEEWHTHVYAGKIEGIYFNKFIYVSKHKTEFKYVCNGINYKCPVDMYRKNIGGIKNGNYRC